jgi:hypothetical protein
MIETILKRASGELVEAEGKLAEDVKQRREELKAAESELKRVRKALGRLGIKSERKERKRGKPAPTKEEVIAVVEDILSEREVVHAEVLEQEVVEAIVRQGKSKMGLSLRIKEALKDKRFAPDDDGYRLARVKAK